MGHIDFSTLLWPAANFTIFASLVVHFYRRFGRPALHARSVHVVKALEKSKGELTQVLHEHRELSDRVQHFEVEERVLLGRFQEEGKHMASVLLEAAHRGAEKVILDGKRQIENEVTRAQKELREEVVSLATKKAREQLRDGFSPEADRVLRRETIGKLL